eukprot:COSAG02_NODE_2635_length_8365_cov_2.690056_4_plen_68_part_00
MVPSGSGPPKTHPGVSWVDQSVFMVAPHGEHCHAYRYERSYMWARNITSVSIQWTEDEYKNGCATGA